MSDGPWIGLSGYSYKPWQGEGRFYPPGLKQSEFLGFYVARYPAVEMDGTWYRMPTEKAVEEWNAKSPASFRFSFKLHRDITHMSRLRLSSIDSVKFMLKRLGPLAKADKLGPLLVQLPPNFRRDDDHLRAFLENLPEAIEDVDTLPRPLQWAIEFRHESWQDPDVEEILRSRGIGWVAADTDDAAAQRRNTADFFYARLRRSEYSAESLDDWARYLMGLGKPCYVYCKHEDEESPWVWADHLLGAMESLRASASSQ